MEVKGEGELVSPEDSKLVFGVVVMLSKIVPEKVNSGGTSYGKLLVSVVSLKRGGRVVLVWRRAAPETRV